MAMPLEVLLTTEQIAAKTQELARSASSSLDSSAELAPLAIAVLKGSFLFHADFVRAWPGEIEIDFIQTSSYGQEKSSSGVVQIRKDLDTNIEGRDVLLVEDIVDTGITLAHLREFLGTRKPKSLQVVALLSKLNARGLSNKVEHIGFEIPNEFVVGYGLDYAERYRNLPYIAILREEG